MKYLISIALLFSSVSHAESFALGDCLHIGRDVYKVTVIGKYSYGMQWQNNSSAKQVFLLPKMDVEKIAVRSDCVDTMQKAQDLYLKSLK